MATAFGIIAIVVGLIGAFVAGWVGIGIAAVFGAIAIIFRIKKNKAEQTTKIAGIVLGIVGIVLGLLTQFAIGSFADKLKSKADEIGEEAALVSAGAPGFKTLGVIGFISKASDAKGDMNDTEFGEALKNQLDMVSKQLN